MKSAAFIFWAMSFCLGMCSAQEAKSKATPDFPPDIRVQRGVSFLAAGRGQQADLYFPLTLPKGQKLPAVVLIHGGGWVGGKRDAGREINIGSNLARHGYVTMSIEYILADKKRAVWPTNLWDCKTAVRWLRKNSERLGVDPDRIGVVGGSAGGHLAAMVALTTPADGLDPAEPLGEVSCGVNCCVDFYGISDIGTYHDASMLGKTFAEAPELYRLASPVTYVRTNSPPMLILHGTADTTVNLRQSELLDATLTRFGVDHHLEVIPGAVHSFDLQPPQRDLRPLVLGFLDRYLKPGQAGK